MQEKAKPFPLAKLEALAVRKKPMVESSLVGSAMRGADSSTERGN